VDTQCRVHGVANLSVAGAGVFPTSGSANPTLTLVALRLRLSDHLRTKLG
jgi:choline dehydrogenase-like flavoprotein